MAALAARMRELGVPVEEDAVTRWGARGDGTSIYVRDPDGNTVELKAYPPGA
jgi:catechol 2,3-dioxygenase-like lactoylglutathione lyase family enzyme